jgi:hypothetical protein
VQILKTICKNDISIPVLDQVFDYLYYGKLSEIKALESHLKNWGEHLLILFTEKLEWST